MYVVLNTKHAVHHADGFDVFLIVFLVFLIY